VAARIIHGDVFDVLPVLTPGSVDCMMTSIPYWQLRSYLPADHPLKPRELGLEASPEEYVTRMVEVFRLVKRVLAPHGTVWLNCGDTFSSGTANANGLSGSGLKRNLKDEGARVRACEENKVARGERRPPTAGIPPGNLCLIPQRLALALQADGWIVRSVVVWCLAPGTVLYAKTATTEGPMTIHDLVRLDPITVKLWTGVKWSQVRGWSETETAGDTVRITLRSGEVFTCTANHRWPLADGRVVAADDLKAGTDLFPGDVLATCATPEPEHTDGGALEELAWFAGLYLVEGNINGDCINISGHTAEKWRHHKVKEIARRYGGSSTLTCEGDTALQRVHGRVLLGAIEHFLSGSGAKGKHFHPRAWLSSNRVLRQLLQGYLDGDGHWDERNQRWRLGFCRNRSLAQDIRSACARLGWVLTLNPTYATMGRTRRLESYRGEIRFAASNHHNAKSRAEVVKIDRGWGGTFYDIGIEDEPHLFALASGVLTHNSKPAPMPASLAGWRWQRCRVKVSSGDNTGSGKQAENRLTAGFNERYHGVTDAGKKQLQGGHSAQSNGKFLPKAIWQACPGCKRCIPNGGYVLRRGSWRPTSSWEPLLFLAKQPGYFSDGIPVQTPPVSATVSRDQYTRVLDDPDEQFAVRHDHETVCAGGANARDVQVWAAEPLKERHYAAFPTALVSWCLRAGTSARGYCPRCGAPWARVVETNCGTADGRASYVDGLDGVDLARTRARGHVYAGESITLGWRATCPHGELPPRPPLVLDPFAGSCRTGLAAARLGCDFIGIELNEDYARMGERLLREDNPLFNEVYESPPDAP